MRDQEYVRVVGDGGLSGYMLGPSDRTDEVAIALDDGREISVPASTLHRQTDGQWRVEGPISQANLRDAGENEVIPVVAEELTVGRRKVRTGTVRVGKKTTEREETVSMPLTRERAVVRRVLVDKPVAAAPPIRREGNEIIFPVVEEVAVVQKQLVLKEEIHVSRQRTTKQHEQTVMLREEQPAIERIDPSGTRSIETIDAVPEENAADTTVTDREALRQKLLGPNQKRAPARRNRILRDT